MYAKLTLMNVSATSFLTAELVDICFMIPLPRKQSTKPMKVNYVPNSVNLFVPISFMQLIVSLLSSSGCFQETYSFTAHCYRLQEFSSQIFKYLPVIYSAQY